MATAFTGSLGWTAAHVVQLGGPPLIDNYARSLPAAAPAFVGHLYGNDGVTANTTTATFGVLNKPALHAKTTNGGYDPVLLEVAAPVSGIALGNVVRLTEKFSPYAGYVYSGIVEGLPDTISPVITKHEILLSPFSIELTRVAVQFNYTTPTDISQMVRDAVGQCQHCSCDQVSVPASTGVLAIADFRNQKVGQVLDTVRSIAGPGWYWYADELGRVWFQAQGSAAVYTLMQTSYEERVSNGGNIQDRLNQVIAVGGVPTGGSANVTAIVNGASQSTIGIRTLDPPIQLPGIPDQATITAIANGILATLDVVWNRVALKVRADFGSRIHQSQPGGAMVRYFEPAVNPMAESAAGSGAYSGPYVLQDWIYDGLYQAIAAGNQPITSQSDINNMVHQWAERAAAISLNITQAALNLKQTLIGSFQSGTGTVAPNGQQGTLWSLTQSEFAAIDPNAVTRAEMGNLGANGVSPAQWGFRASDATGTPIFDSLGLIAVMKSLGSTNNNPGSTTSTSFATISGSGISWTSTRTLNYLALFLGVGSVSSEASGNAGFIRANVVGQTTSGNLTFGTAGFTCQSAWLFVNQLPAGSYTIELDWACNQGGFTFSSNSAVLQLFQLGA
jgi:hypothetical protein